MAEVELEVRSLPRFATDAAGKAVEVSLTAQAYVALLVQANVTDPALWPPGAQEGADMLKRVRQIEAACIAEHGEFDWEKLSEEVQDEYDGLCAFLDELQDTGERVPLRELLENEGATGR